jgi:hypothetical protein
MLTLLDRTVLVLALAGVLSLALGATFWFTARRLARRIEPKAVVGAHDAVLTVYPYVFVNDAGAVRELSGKERNFLQTPFLPHDAHRPYVKSAYEDRNLAGTLRGYCRRTVIPRGVRIAYPPIEIATRQRNAPPHFTRPRLPEAAARTMLY